MNKLIEDMLELELGFVVSLDDLSESQEKAIEYFNSGENILMVSSAGSGKSFCIKKMKEKTKKRMYLTATTGVASYSIEGMTINSFLGIGTGEMSAQEMYKKVRFSQIYMDRITNLDVLVIDEISMMSACLFEKINYVMMAVRKNPKFFGGVQVILSGDFMQAPPVFKDRSKDCRLIFESELIRENFKIVKLDKNFRQYDDTRFSELLSRLRVGNHTKEDINLIYSRMVSCLNPERYIFLTSTNKKAGEINRFNMEKIQEKEYHYPVFCRGNPELKKELKTQLKIKDMENLVLKKNARVMLVKNIEVESGLVNGAMGVVNDIISGYPEVKFDNGVTRLIKEESWDLEVDGKKATAKQLPLAISYACSIHKSQSLTLKKAILDLEGVFCEHMVYVALSRVSTLEGVYINSFNPDKIKISKKCLDFSTSNFNN